jgi:glycosyltransferase involved in cell wall biosynthesis/GT2 family glycosyltransferase
MELEEIRKAFNLHAKGAASLWTLIELPNNLGFSGGNNVGINHFIQHEDISHVCLLNSDVIVTDYWLDHLIEKKCDIISGVTNKADSEQCVPIDYDLDISKCLDPQKECLYPNVVKTITVFAENRYKIWKGFVEEADPTFFCVVISKNAISKIGMLDEAFFPGGFEDDDFCIRARRMHCKPALARDVYIHHWGSASFGQLQYEYFSSRSLRNRQYLESKHHIQWQRKAEMPFVSYFSDLRYAIKNSNLAIVNKSYHKYWENLDSLLNHFSSEFKNLRIMLEHSRHEIPSSLSDQVAKAASCGELTTQCNKIISAIPGFLADNNISDEKVKEFDLNCHKLTHAIHEQVECNFAICAFLQLTGQTSNKTVIAAPASRYQAITITPSKLKRAWNKLKKAIPFFLKLRGVVFFGGYFYPERQSDGYFQRIQIIDKLFIDRWRIYVESDELPGRSHWIDRPEPKVLVLRINGGRKRRAMVKMLALLAVLRCRKIYFHSVLRMNDNGFGRLMHVPGLRKIIDIHGVVPEEFRFHNDFFSAVLYDGWERLAVRKSNVIIVVTEAMHNYLRQKFRTDLRGEVVAFPIFPNVMPCMAERPPVGGKPIVVYAGGLHKWQQTPKMIDAIIRTSDFCLHHFYSPAPDAVRNMLPENFREKVVIGQKTHSDLMKFYAQCHYGFILREDIVVNHAACPTKLIEYLAMGIVPIVDCENIGDFKSFGMGFISLPDFLAGKLPTEEKRQAIALKNLAVYECLRKIRQTGAEKIYFAFTENPLKSRVAAKCKKILPHNTLHGKVVRSLWHAIKPTTAVETRSNTAVPQVRQNVMPSVEILMQVDNFETGGLENVVLDLCETMMNAKYKTAVLALGVAGASVEKARKRGIPVIISRYDHNNYSAMLKQLAPKLVMTHYSIHGADICASLNIPFIQVIHNAYMWFSESQLADFAQAAKCTQAFIAVSEYARQYSVQRLGVPKNKCLVIPNGIDYAKLNDTDLNKSRQKLREHYGFDSNNFIFIDIGAINHQKNHIAIVRAFESFHHNHNSAKLIIVGPSYEPQLRSEIKKYIADHDLEASIIYIGVAENAYEYYAMADAFVGASFFEGGPLTLLEALSTNLPAIIPAVGLAAYFAGRPGIEVIAPPFDILNFYGNIWEMQSMPDFEQRLTAAMTRVYNARVKPNLDKKIIEALDKRNTYLCYVELIQDIIAARDIQNKSFPNVWTEHLKNAHNLIEQV